MLHREALLLTECPSWALLCTCERHRKVPELWEVRAGPFLLNLLTPILRCAELVGDDMYVLMFGERWVAERREREREKRKSEKRETRKEKEKKETTRDRNREGGSENKSVWSDNFCIQSALFYFPLVLCLL